MNPIRTRTAEYSLLADNIILCRILENVNIQPADIKENLGVTLQLADGKPYVALVDGRGESTITREARELAAKPESYLLQLASAIVVNTTSSRLIVNFIIKFYKPPVPTKLFSDIDLALIWLKTRLK